MSNAAENVTEVGGLIHPIVICKECGAYGPSWDSDTVSGRSNSSAEFNYLVTQISSLIRSSARSLMSGDTDSASRIILARLAHVYGIVITKSIEDMQAADV